MRECTCTWCVVWRSGTYVDWVRIQGLLADITHEAVRDRTVNHDPGDEDVRR